jgi:hypothetical protein
MKSYPDRGTRMAGACTLGLVVHFGGVCLAGASEAVSGFSGSFSQAVAIEVPAFRGLEPRLALGYSSQGRGGFPGVGWGLAGFSLVERASPGLGVPHYDVTDVFVLNGQELIPCQSPNCTTGGTHTTKVESYLRISFAGNSWIVIGKDGTRTTLMPVFTTPSGTLAWGQTSVVDTHGNAATYSWNCDTASCDTGDFYPDSVNFGPYSVKLYRETRPDVMSAATGSANALRWTHFRLRSILVKYQASPLRAYKLTYATSPVNGRSLLASVQQYGKDVAIDSSGAISGGTSLPARVFEYQTDPGAGAFQLHFPQ